jgi:hypothetical protein
MRLFEILERCKGQKVVINNGEERVLAGVDEDFIVLQGGNPQMKITEFVPIGQITKVIRADYAAGHSSISLDLVLSAGDQKRSTGEF